MDLDLVEEYDRHLIERGAYIATERAALMARMVPILMQNMRSLAAKHERMGLTYVSDGTDKHFGQKFRAAFAKDRVLQRTTVGIHKDDFIWTLDGQPLKTVGSQGEQKYALLALRLTQLQCVAQTTSRAPLLLMDDVFDGLDQRRAKLLVALIQSPACPGQVLVTHSETARAGTLGRDIRNAGPSLLLTSDA